MLFLISILFTLPSSVWLHWARMEGEGPGSQKEQEAGLVLILQRHQLPTIQACVLLSCLGLATLLL